MTSYVFHVSGFTSPLNAMAQDMESIMFPVEALAENGATKVLQAVDRFKVDTLLGGGKLLLELAKLEEASWPFPEMISSLLNCT